MPLPPPPTSQPAIVATYTVDPNGPIKTIAAAARLVKPGDIVLIMPGTYHESIRMTTSGDTGKQIVFEAQTPGTVIIDGTGFATVINSSWGATTNITLKNITVQHCANPLPTQVRPLVPGPGGCWIM